MLVLQDWWSEDVLLKQIGIHETAIKIFEFMDLAVDLAGVQFVLLNYNLEVTVIIVRLSYHLIGDDDHV